MRRYKEKETSGCSNNHGGQNSIIADGVIVNKKQVLKDKDVIIIANAKLLFSSNGINLYDI